MAEIETHYAAQGAKISHLDGVSVDFDDWHFNVRSSNTEPLIRLNIESRGSEELMRAQTAEVLGLLAGLGAVPADH